ncbi:acyl carrier protein [Bdellovibrio bacteriovorus]|uniref:Acyl carrier protein n=1 Tax=Bdellovibrio bacteriovorus TaxID=959 RepID=A0A150WM05_BDEBC|nr:acyl carrier protein [Bdellovibrio bacteriovorus]KYG64733.1 acyl carrier protein [Bdellovibrio bacteriovorus]
MNHNEILEQLTPIFAKVFFDESIKISEKTTAADVVGWDSLNHVALISEVENHFNVQFDIDDIVSMKNVGDMVALIQKNVD